MAIGSLAVVDGAVNIATMGTVNPGLAETSIDLFHHGEINFHGSFQQADQESVESFKELAPQLLTAQAAINAANEGDFERSQQLNQQLQQYQSRSDSGTGERSSESASFNDMLDAATAATQHHRKLQAEADQRRASRAGSSRAGGQGNANACIAEQPYQDGGKTFIRFRNQCSGKVWVQFQALSNLQRNPQSSPSNAVELNAGASRDTRLEWASVRWVACHANAKGYSSIVHGTWECRAP